MSREIPPICVLKCAAFRIIPAEVICTDQNKLQNDGIPVGFGMALAMHPGGMEAFAALSEQKKEEYLNRARNAKSKKEMQQIVQSLLQGSSYTG
jgi:uncharacterized protein YdeI (YjbR/CyaY-like superfamily)